MFFLDMMKVINILFTLIQMFIDFMYNVIVVLIGGTEEQQIEKEEPPQEERRKIGY